jgi:PAS domain S-box-containing protein
MPESSDDGHPSEIQDVTVRALIEAAPDGILLVDDRGMVLFSNHEAEAMFGFDRDGLAGRSVEELLPEQMREVHRAHRTRYRGAPRRRPMGAGLLLHGRRVDGSEFPVEISLSPLTTEAGPRIVAVVRDVSERIATERRLRQAEQHLRIVEDRERIARDLHDVVIQKLFAAGMTVQSVAARAADPEHSARLHRVVDELDDTIKEIRSVIFSLQSDTHDRSGLRAGVLRVVDEEREALGFEPRIRFDGPVDVTSDHIAADLLPAVREALSNVARHAHATAVEIDVELREGSLVLRVADDGVGVSTITDEGNGIRNLAARAEKLGGRCSVIARPEGGTVLEWQVPDA